MASLPVAADRTASSSSTSTCGFLVPSSSRSSAAIDDSRLVHGHRRDVGRRVEPGHDQRCEHRFRVDHDVLFDHHGLGGDQGPGQRVVIERVGVSGDLMQHGGDLGGEFFTDRARMLAVEQLDHLRERRLTARMGTPQHAHAPGAQIRPAQRRRGQERDLVQLAGDRTAGVGPPGELPEPEHRRSEQRHDEQPAGQVRR